MYGRPAKCVACHQKWFIPEKDEIPDTVPFLHLNEHPELLRLPGQSDRFVSGVSEEFLSVPDDFPLPSSSITDIDMGGIFFDNKSSKTNENKEVSEQISTDDIFEKKENFLGESDGVPVPNVVVKKTAKIPLEPCEPLQLLFSYKEELNKRISALGETATENSQKALLISTEKALLRTQEKTVDYLKQEQRSAAKRLIGLENEIARLNIALRVGDCSLALFTSQITDLRQVREQVERQNHNLLAWSEIKDSFMAGGALNVSLDSFDETTFEINVSDSSLNNSGKPLFIFYGEELRDMLQMRGALERRKIEWERMVSEQDSTVDSLKEGLAETEGALIRNTACIRFFRQRMDQLLLDYKNDLKALAKYKEEIIEHATKKHLQEHTQQEILQSIAAAENNIIRMQSFLRQALTANSDVEVPRVSTTVMHRLRGSIGHNTFAMDTPLFSSAALLIIVGLLMSAETGVIETDWLAVFSTCVAIGLAVFTMLVDKNLRAPVVLVLWILLMGLLLCFVYYRTSMDTYLLVIDGNVGLPVINTRGLLVVVGTVFLGTGVGVSLSNYKWKTWNISVINRIALIVFCTILSGGTVALMHTIAPRASALTIEIQEMAAENNIPESSRENERVHAVANNNRVGDTLPGRIVTGDGSEEELVTEEDGILFLMQGVLHGEDAAPRFKGSLSYPDGRVENVSLKLGDSILGDWKAHEYSRYTQKLTISNGKRLLILKAGAKVLLPQPSIETS